MTQVRWAERVERGGSGIETGFTFHPRYASIMLFRAAYATVRCTGRVVDLSPTRVPGCRP